MYEIFAKLLADKNIKAIDVSKATGINSAVFSEWKKGKSSPKVDKLQKIADYFDVPLEYLVTGKMSNKNEDYYLDPETHKLAQEIYDNPEYRVLFDASRKLSPEDIQFVIDMINKMKHD